MSLGQVEAMLVRYRHALTEMQALILLAAERDGTPLDPFEPDGATVLLHAERLVLDGTPVRAAIAAGRDALRAHAELRLELVPELENGEPPGYAHELPVPPTRIPCGHTRLWGARDGRWRCAVCEPSGFPGEALAAAEAEP